MDAVEHTVTWSPCICLPFPTWEVALFARIALNPSPRWRWQAAVQRPRDMASVSEGINELRGRPVDIDSTWQVAGDNSAGESTGCDKGMNGCPTGGEGHDGKGSRTASGQDADESRCPGRASRRRGERSSIGYALLAGAGGAKGCASGAALVASWPSVGIECRDQGDVDCERPRSALQSQWQSIGNDFDSPVVEEHGFDVEVAHEDTADEELKLRGLGSFRLFSGQRQRRRMF